MIINLKSTKYITEESVVANAFYKTGKMKLLYVTTLYKGNVTRSENRYFVVSTVGGNGDNVELNNLTALVNYLNQRNCIPVDIEINEI